MKRKRKSDFHFWLGAFKKSKHSIEVSGRTIINNTTGYRYLFNHRNELIDSYEIVERSEIRWVVHTCIGYISRNSATLLVEDKARATSFTEAELLLYLDSAISDVIMINEESIKALGLLNFSYKCEQIDN